MLINNISVVIIAHNAQSTIKKCLDNLSIFKEVILYLNNMTDDTKNIACNFKNVRIIEGEFSGFGLTKNKASEYSTNDWILSLDSDEILNKTFIKNLANIQLKEDSVYRILRKNYYQSTHVKHCWGNDNIVRLYNRKKTSFTNNKVHEKIISNHFNITQIDGFIKHFPYANPTDFIIKLDRYSTLFAQENVGKKSSSLLKAIFNAKFSFFKTYILKGGFMDGYAGLIIAFSHMTTNFYKYIKLYEANKELRNENFNH